MEQHEGTHVAGGLDQIRRRAEVDAGTTCQSLDRQCAVARVGIDAGADRGSAQIDLLEQLIEVGDAIDVFAQSVGEGAEFLAQRHRHRVLQLGATHLDHIIEFQRLAGEGIGQFAQRVHQHRVAAQQADTDGGGVGVVGGLRHVDVIVGVQLLVIAFLVAEEFQAQIGDHFVGIHVGRGAGAALDHVDHELIMMVAIHQTRTGVLDGIVFACLEIAQRMVGFGGGRLDQREPFDETREVRQRHAGEVEVVQRSLGLHTVVGVSRHRLAPEEILFKSEAVGQCLTLGMAQVGRRGSCRGGIGGDGGFREMVHLGGTPG